MQHTPIREVPCDIALWARQWNLVDLRHRQAAHSSAQLRNPGTQYKQDLTQVYNPFNSSSDTFMASDALPAPLLAERAVRKQCRVANLEVKALQCAIAPMIALQESEVSFSPSLLITCSAQHCLLQHSVPCEVRSLLSKTARDPSICSLALHGRCCFNTVAMLGAIDKQAVLSKPSPLCSQQRQSRRKAGPWKTVAMAGRPANRQPPRQSRKKGELPESGYFAPADPKGSQS